MTKSHYDLLGAPSDATPTQLRRAYLKRARQLHPDQFGGRPQAERVKAERRMQDLNAAWTVLSDPESRRAYDVAHRHAFRGTAPIVSARGDAWEPLDGLRDPVPKPPSAPKVANERDMEIRGPAKLLRPIPLLVLFVGLAAVIAVASLVAGSGDDEPSTNRPAPRVEPIGTPLGCVDLSPRAEEVPCGDHDAVFWSIIEAQQSCNSGLEPIYRDGEGGLFCVTRVG